MSRGLTAIIAVACLTLAPAPAGADTAGFERESLDIFDRHLFDLGVADYEDDGDLDLFTTNHLARQSLLVNDGAGALTEGLYPAGLAQTRAFPGLEDRGRPPIVGPGLYISMQRSMLLRHVGPGRARGRVEFLFPIKVGRSGNASAEVRRARGRHPDRFVARFTLRRDSRLRLKPTRSAHPYRVRLGRAVRPARAFVGAGGVNPTRRRFTLQLRDRHGIAWTDTDGDRHTDAFVVRGGLMGRIGDVAPLIQDELLRGSSDGRLRLARRQPRKGDCRGRQAGAADLDADGRPDLFATCRGDAPRLYRARSRGFENITSNARAAGLDAERLRFGDLDGDPRPEAVAITDGGVKVFQITGAGTFRLEQTLAGRHGSAQSAGIALGDPDADRDLDLYVASPSGSTLLRNRGGRLRARDPRAFGLPGSALAAAWVDHDADGRLDLHTVPNGLFAKRAGFRFDPAGALKTVSSPRDARVAWPDLDNDGDRDAVITAIKREAARNFRTFAYFNPGGGRWLQVEPVGRRRNPQAIGARVRVRSGDLVQTQWVGQNETSLYSQGHYRTYFGLGAEATARVRIRWPDGRTESLGEVAADQVLRPRE